MEDSTTCVDELKLDVTMEVCGSTCAAATADTVDQLPSHTGGAEADTNLSHYVESRSRPERGQAASKTLATIAAAQPVSVLATPIRSNNNILDSRACVRIDLGGLHCSGKNVTEENPPASSQNPTPSTAVAPMRVFQPDEGRTHPVPNVTLTTNSRRLVPVASRDRAKMSFVKPNCSYNCLIGMALLAHERLPVGGIYSYIRWHFPYFKTSAPEGWKNSIRHSLSLGTYFRKAMPLQKLQKGFYWEIAPHAREKIRTDVENFIKVARNNPSLKPNLPTLKDLHLEEPSPSKQYFHSSQNGGTKNGELSPPPGLPPSLHVCSPQAITPVQPTSSSISTDQQLLEKPVHQRIEPLREDTEDPFETLTTSPVELTVLLSSLSQILPAQEGDPYTDSGLAPPVTAALVPPNVSTVTLEPSKVLDATRIPLKLTAPPKLSTDPPNVPIIPFEPLKQPTAPPRLSTDPPNVLTISLEPPKLPIAPPKLSTDPPNVLTISLEPPTAPLGRPQVLDAPDHQGQQEQGMVSAVVARVAHSLQRKQAPTSQQPKVSINKASEEKASALKHSTNIREQHEREKDGPKCSEEKAPPIADSQWEEAMDEQATEREEATFSADVSVSVKPDELKRPLSAEEPPEPWQLKEPHSHSSMDIAPQCTATTTTAQPTPYALPPIASVCHSSALPQQLPKAHVPVSNGGGSQDSAALPKRASAKGNPKKRRGKKTLQQPQEKRVFPVFPRMAYAYVPRHGFAPYPPVHMWNAHHMFHPQPVMPLGNYYHMPGAWQHPCALSGNVTTQQAHSNTNKGSNDNNPCRDGVHSAHQLQAAWQAAQYAQHGMPHMLPRSYHPGWYPYPLQTQLQPSMLNPIPCNNFPAPTAPAKQTATTSGMPIPVLSTNAAQSYVESQDDTSGGEAELKPSDQKRPKLQQKLRKPKGKAKVAESKKHGLTTSGLDTTEFEPPSKPDGPHWSLELSLEGPQDASLADTQPPTVHYCEHMGNEEQGLNSSPVCSESNQVPSCLGFNVDQLIQALEETENYLKLQMDQGKQDVTKAHAATTDFLPQSALGATVGSNSVSAEGLVIVSEANTKQNTGVDITEEVCEGNAIAAAQGYVSTVHFKELLPVTGRKEPKRDTSLPNSGPLQKFGST